MKFADVQAYFAARVADSSALSPFGEALIWDPFADNQKSATAIADRLRDKGVAIEIGFPKALDTETNIGGSSFVNVSVPVFVAEHPGEDQAHSPAKAALIDAVIKDLTARPNPTQQAARFREHYAEFNSDGMLQHMFIFFLPTTVKHTQ